MELWEAAEKLARRHPGATILFIGVAIVVADRSLDACRGTEWRIVVRRTAGDSPRLTSRIEHEAGVSDVPR